MNPSHRHPGTHPSVRQRAQQLRHPLAPMERQLWMHLRDRQLAGLKFRRQYPVGSFVVDFYCALHRVVIEVDGDSHSDQMEHDLHRAEWLQNNGFRVVRFTNREVLTSLHAVLEFIKTECHGCSSTLTPALSLKGRGGRT